MTTTKTEAWTLLYKESQLYIKTIKMQMEVWTLSDGGSQLYALLQARIRRELIL
jgi:hypothetical protein